MQEATLNCELQIDPESEAGGAERQIVANLGDFSDDGVWKFEGKITNAGEPTGSHPISGYFYQYDSAKFDLMASTDRERITIMSDNKILKERGVQGVIMPEGGHISAGTPLSATCQTSLPNVGNQRYEVPEQN